MSLLLILFLILTIFVPGANHPDLGRESWSDFFKQFSFPAIDIKGLVRQIIGDKIWINSFSDYVLTILLVMKAMGMLFETGKRVFYGSPCSEESQTPEYETSKEFTGILERDLERPVSEWQGVWENFGKFVGLVAPPNYWDFTPEQVLNPDEMTHRLLEGCSLYEDPNMRSFALNWGLASAYRIAVDHLQKVMAETVKQVTPPATQTKPSVTSPTPPPAPKTAPSTTQATPQPAQVKPPATPVTPSVMQTIPSNPRATPPVTQTTPPVTEPIPSEAQATPSATQVMPSVTHATPSTTRTVPSATQVVPQATPTLPPSAQAAPTATQTISPVTQATPPAAETISSVTHTVPPRSLARARVRGSGAKARGAMKVRASARRLRWNPGARQTMPLVNQTVLPVTQTVPPAAQVAPPVTPTIPPATKAVPPVTQTVSSATETAPSETQVTPPATQATAPVTQVKTPKVEVMTETGTQTTDPIFIIAPISKKKTWIREPTERVGPIPRLQRTAREEEEEEEEEGAYGPPPSGYVAVEDSITSKAEGTVARSGARPRESGAQPRVSRAQSKESLVQLEESGARPKELGARPKEVGTRPKEVAARPKEPRPPPKEEGAAAAPTASKLPRRIITPQYSLLDCTSEELEEYLRSRSPSPPRAASTALPPPHEMPERPRSPSPPRSDSYALPPSRGGPTAQRPPRGARERRRSASPPRADSYALPPPRGARERRRSASPPRADAHALPPPRGARERRRTLSPARADAYALPPPGGARERRRSPSPSRTDSTGLPLPHGWRERRRSPSPQRPRPLPPRGRRREEVVMHRRDARDPYAGVEVWRESEVLRSMTPAELRDLRKDFSRQPGERILTWLVRCWDNGATSHMLEGHEARQLGSLARDREIEYEIARETASRSLWLRLLHAVRERYPFKEYLTNAPRKWATAEEGVQYLRELAMLELLYCDPDYYDCLEPEKIRCKYPMWKKVVKGAPASLVHCLITVYHPKMDEPEVGDMCAWIRTIVEDMEDLESRHQHTYVREKVERPCEHSRCGDDYRDRDYRDRSVRCSRRQSRPRSWSRSRSRSSSFKSRRRESSRRRSRNQLWSYLRNKGENMRKWDGEPTSRLEARVRELKRKEADKKIVYVVAKDPQSPKRKKTEVCFNDNKKASSKSKQKSDTESSDQDQ